MTAPTSNTRTSVAIFTSVGFSQLSVSDYSDAVVKLQPDIVIGLGDIPVGPSSFSQKRSEAMTDRTTAWTPAQVKAIASGLKDRHPPVFFAPLLPLPAETQRWYLEELSGDSINGLAVYSTSTLDNLPEPLHRHPKLAFTEPESPQHLLRQIAQGIDVFTIPFITTSSDAGIALDFHFPATSIDNSPPRPMGVDMWSEVHATDLSPLSEGCTCYACTDHHRAYLRHLLAAKEMLAWTLLQIHNHHIMDKFFEGVRTSLANDSFDNDCQTFERVYEPRLPDKTGQGPRLRGYQYRSEGPGETKRNPTVFNRLDDVAAKVAESADTNPIADVKDVEATGFAEKSE